MKRILAAAATALVLSAASVQPSQASPAAVPFMSAGGWILLSLAGTVVCQEMTVHKLEAWAARNGKVVTPKQRWHSLAGCAFPPIGFAKLLLGHHHHKK